MMRGHVAALGMLQVAGLCALLWRGMPVQGAASDASQGTGTWDRHAAASYLDGREVWWQQWKPAQMDHGTMCISCHTTVPYAMVRPRLRSELREGGVAAPEKALLESVTRRVSDWPEMVPFYSDARDGAGKTAQSHATEAVLNAVILASNDEARPQLQPVTEAALDHAWALQETAGANAGGWIWQDFHLSPWESTESSYQGAALLMVALHGRRDDYTERPAVRAHMELLRGYLERNYAAQPLLNQLYVLWAEAQAPGLLGAAERARLLATVQGLQQADGGWRLSALDRAGVAQGRPEVTESDAYATALIVLATRPWAAGEWLGRGVGWLRGHQRPEGDWRASSLNKERVPESNIGRFMSDAATAYAVLALEQEAVPAGGVAASSGGVGGR